MAVEDSPASPLGSRLSGSQKVCLACLGLWTLVACSLLLSGDVVEARRSNMWDEVQGIWIVLAALNVVVTAGQLWWQAKRR